ncbi:hypothetical protein Btru_060628 [Bulinus truncatus]|nr:hypothetical protein Btru_060628 [Bulinus truncatus]
MTYLEYKNPIDDRDADIYGTDIYATDICSTDIYATYINATNIYATNIYAADIYATDICAPDIMYKIPWTPRKRDELHHNGRCGHSLTLLLVIVLPASLTGRQCNKVDSCSCKFDDNGAVVNLQPLAKSDGKPLFLDVYGQDGSYYSYNPCVAFNEDDCHSAAFCQRQYANSSAVLLANQKNVNFGYDGHNVQVTYQPDGLGKLVTVSYVCIQHSSPLFRPFGYDNVTRQYNFEVQTECACDNVCYVAPDNGGISTGSVLLIIFFVMVFLYIVVGSVFGKVSKGASGTKVLPHHEFWMEFPGLVRDGYLYTVRCTCCKPAPTTYDQV